MQAEARDQGTKLWTSRRSLHSASSVRSGSEGWPFGPLGLQLQVGPAWSPQCEKGGLCLVSTHPVADPARLGEERGQLPGPKPRRAEVIAGCWAGWELGERQAGGVGVRPGQELWLRPPAAFVEGLVGALPVASPLS